MDFVCQYRAVCLQSVRDFFYFPEMINLAAKYPWATNAGLETLKVKHIQMLICKYNKQ